ncbi:MAG: TetR/AcrR family transcriptional regulator [Spirosomataceae bacterium]
MGVTERKERERQEMRQRILDAAQQVFVEEGYEKASIRNIAERIEYSPATIYLYFKDKDELFYVVHEMGFAKMLGEMKVLDSIENPLEQLRQRGYLYMKFALENPELYDLMFIQKGPMQALHKRYKNSEWECGFENFNLLRLNITACIEHGLIRSTNLDITTMSIWSFIHGLVSLYIRERFNAFEETIDIEKVMYASIEQMIEMIKV